MCIIHNDDKVELMKGIILAGGKGSRLFPITSTFSKQLAPVYDKPLIYYPLATLMLAGIRQVLIISTAEDKPLFLKLLRDGSDIGMEFTYKVQNSPDGLAQALILADEFLDGSKSALILGDNIFHGAGVGRNLELHKQVEGAQIFASLVTNPEAYGVVEFDSSGKTLSIEEKPEAPKSKYAIPGLYFFDEMAPEYARKIKPSPRGELEITSLLEIYLFKNQLKTEILQRGTAWLDTGTFDALFAAASYVKIIEERQGLKISCPEEIAWRSGWITSAKLSSLADQYSNSNYGSYLRNLLD